MSNNRTRILFDLEATCWEDKEFQKEHSEIIEIGAVKFDCKSFEIESTFQTVVKPTIQPILSDYCINLTSISQDEVGTAILFPEAYNTFMEWAKDCPLFIGWGETDYHSLETDCKRNGFHCFPPRKYMNGKQLYTYFSGIRGGGLKKRLTTEKLEFEGKQHRALNDALMTVKLLKKVWFDF